MRRTLRLIRGFCFIYPLDIPHSFHQSTSILQSDWRVSKLSLVHVCFLERRGPQVHFPTKTFRQSALDNLGMRKYLCELLPISTARFVVKIDFFCVQVPEVVHEVSRNKMVKPENSVEGYSSI